MQLLKCKFCRSEADLVNTDNPIIKNVKCSKCGLISVSMIEKDPEIYIRKK